jgi:molybdenum cofactor biosynthesis enzyme
VPDALDLTAVDLTPVEMECLRCRQVALMRFAGMCATCRDELLTKYEAQGRTIDVADYEPKMNVTPNAVALKDD